MGKWSTYRKRGTPTRGPALPPPPAPELDIDGDDIRQLAMGDDDTGGQLKLQVSADGNPPWNPVGDAAWEVIYVWSDVDEFSGESLRAYEVGNGTVYSGNSEFSTVLDVP